MREYKVKVNQEIVIADTKDDLYLNDVRITVRTNLSNPFVSLPQQELCLTLDGLNKLILALESVKELIGQDFIVHHNGHITITVDDGDKLVGTDYDNLRDYLNNTPSAN